MGPRRQIAQTLHYFARPHRAVGTGKPLGALTRDDFPLPTLDERIRAWRAEIPQGDLRGRVRDQGFDHQSLRATASRS